MPQTFFLGLGGSIMVQGKGLNFFLYRCFRNVFSKNLCPNEILRETLSKPQQGSGAAAAEGLLAGCFLSLELPAGLHGRHSLEKGPGAGQSLPGVRFALESQLCLC